MVSSKINSEINYIETKLLDTEDIKHLSSIYIIELYDTEIPIILGKPKYTFMEKGVLYFPIYIINAKTKRKCQIGIFEVESTDTLKYVDEDGDIDIEKIGEPLLYSFTTEQFIKKNNSTENIKTIIEKYDTADEDTADIADTADITDTDKHRRRHPGIVVVMMTIQIIILQSYHHRHRHQATTRKIH